ncbi:hypothetical protein ACFVKC_01815 [Streptomyces noursei]|uniref:hypothetical protein n=1 Tax=Streptomyces noursei TaxID=1971 RepID=UPI00363F7DED
MHAALYACRACLYQLDQRVLAANMRKDASALPANRGTRIPEAGRHRRAAS